MNQQDEIDLKLKSINHQPTNAPTTHSRKAQKKSGSWVFSRVAALSRYTAAGSIMKSGSVGHWSYSRSEVMKSAYLHSHQKQKKNIDNVFARSVFFFWGGAINEPTTDL